MKSGYRPLGELIELVDVRNTDGSVQNLIGVSINKCFIKSVANTIGTDLSTYKIIERDDFAVSLMQVSRDEKIPIACLKEYDKAIMSPAYPIFRVKNREEVLPDYLDLWFKRSEFDREAAFIAVGGVRGSMPWEDFCRMQVRVPDLEEQKKIVHAYKVIEDRINLKKRINENLEAIAQAYFDELFIPEIEPDCTLADISEINSYRELKKGVTARCFDMSTLPTNGAIPTGDIVKPYEGGVKFTNGDTLIARITPCLENGKAAYINILKEGEVAFGSTEYIVFSAKDDMPSSFYYFLVRNSQFVKFSLQFMNGSSGRQRVSGDELSSFPMVRPSSDNLVAFDKIGSLVLEQMRILTGEIELLQRLQKMLGVTLSSQ